MKQYIRISLLGLVALTMFFVGCDNTNDTHYADANWDNADLVRGGLLYDKWWDVNGSATPSSDFDPIWASQSTNARSGGDTWRCKECHGWDYIGKDGRYSGGSHYTGFNGVMDASSNSHAAIFDAIKDAGGDHDLSDQLSDADVLDLVKFITEGLFDMYAYIDPVTYAGTGNATNGGTLYATNCEFCHGADGKNFDFESEDGVQGVGWLSNDNPQEVFHKIRWGHPGSLGTAEEMPSMVYLGLTDAEIGHRLTFVQTVYQ